MKGARDDRCVSSKADLFRVGQGDAGVLQRALGPRHFLLLVRHELALRRQERCDLQQRAAAWLRRGIVGVPIACCVCVRQQSAFTSVSPCSGMGGNRLATAALMVGSGYAVTAAARD